MQLKQLLKALLNKILSIAVLLCFIFLFYKSLRWLEIKGFIGICIGMAIMAVILIHPKTAAITKFLIHAFRGDINLINFLRGQDNEKEEEYIEIKR